MINYHFESDFNTINKDKYSNWIRSIIQSESFNLGTLDYIFCDDAYLLNINKEYLNHDTYTDIITFDYTVGKVVAGDIFISIERVIYNANKFNVDFVNELHRVMSHGVLHLMGYKDKTEEDSLVMRQKEEEKINMFHVEQ